MPSGTVTDHDQHTHDDQTAAIAERSATARSGAPATPSSSSAFPPPPPPSATTMSASTRLLALAAVAALAFAVVMTVLWIGARQDGDVAAERDAAREQLTATASQLDDTQSRLAEADDALIRTQQLLDDTRLDLSAAEQALLDAPTEADVAEVDALRAQIAGFEEAATEDAAEIARLEAELAEAVANGTDETAAAFDPATAPAFSRYIGELLSSRTGSSRLGQEASTCYGATIINLIGLDAIGAGQNNIATSASRDTVVGAMQQAAAACNIDPGLIFS